MGHVVPSVYNQIKREIAAAESVCAAGQRRQGKGDDRRLGEATRLSDRSLSERIAQVRGDEHRHPRLVDVARARARYACAKTRREGRARDRRRSAPWPARRGPRASSASCRRCAGGANDQGPAAARSPPRSAFTPVSSNNSRRALASRSTLPSKTSRRVRRAGGKIDLPGVEGMRGHLAEQESPVGAAQRRHREAIVDRIAGKAEFAPRRGNRRSRSAKKAPLSVSAPSERGLDRAPAQKQHPPVEQRGLRLPQSRPVRRDARRLTFGERPARGLEHEVELADLEEARRLAQRSSEPLETMTTEPPIVAARARRPRS